MSIATGTVVDRRRGFFVYMALALAITVLWGFASTYFLRSFLTTRDLSVLVHAHGLVFSGWIALFVTQTVLVARHRTDIHQRLGFAGIMLAAAVVGLGVAADIASLRPAQRAAWEAVGGPMASFAWLASRNAGNPMIFGLLFAAAVFVRRRSEAHKRLMLLACLALMNAPVARILDELGWPIVLTPFGFVAPGNFFNQALAPLLAPFRLINLIVLPFFLGLVLYDFGKTKRLHRATLAGGLVLFLFQPFFFMVLRGLR